MTALPESEERLRALAAELSTGIQSVASNSTVLYLLDERERLRASLVEASEVIREDHRRLLDERGHECDLPCACVYCTALVPPSDAPEAKP